MANADIIHFMKGRVLYIRVIDFLLSVSEK